MLSGEAGIGKTTVLATFAQEVHGRGDHAVVYGRCDEGAAVPLQPFRGLIGWCVGHASTALLEAHAARYGGELLRIAPQLAERVSTPDPTTSDDATERFLLFDAVADVLRRIAGDRVLVVMLDDLHWAERTALALLRHLSRALADAPVVLIVTYRDSERLSDEFRQVLADFDRADAQRIELRGFDDADLADLVTIEAGAVSPEVTARLREDSAGNPLYATQLPPSLGRVGGTRARRPRARCRRACTTWCGAASPRSGVEPSEVLSASSVLGTEFAVDLLPRSSTSSSRLWMTHWTRRSRPGCCCPSTRRRRRSASPHALVANALYAELQPVQRRRLHERARPCAGRG